MIFQKEIVIEPHPRGFHLISENIFNVLPKMSGLVHVFIKHTSASLTINENADPSVRVDFETHFNKLVSDQDDHYTHITEGLDDMTSHIKSSLLGSSISFPITDGIPQIGIWQGIYLCEHRDHASSRKLFITIIGE
jgi:secondary thiamine-phosphate synthase enzyme|tara:strand:- start:2511 stop:2918 length:408 start_codon:yes stop_codon:yes gene_type:complete